MGRYAGLLEEIRALTSSNTVLPSHCLSIASVPTFTPDQIKRIRLDANMTQATFAAVIGVTAKSVEAWEGGRSRPDGAARRTLGLLSEDPLWADKAGVIVR